jgi:hypothetical protein
MNIKKQHQQAATLRGGGVLDDLYKPPQPKAEVKMSTEDI